MNLSPVNIEKFLKLHGQLSGVEYGLGAKAEGGQHPTTRKRWNPRSTGKLTTPVSTIENIDCSGYVRYMIYHCAGGLQIPDGSWIQREYMERNGVDQVGYKEAAANRDDDLFIAFATPNTNGVGAVGHVWFVLNGKTYESYSSKGVGSLPATQSWRASHVHKTFVLPVAQHVAVQPTYTLKQSNGAEMAKMPTFDGHNYVPARTWGTWFGQEVNWNAKAGSIEMRKPDGFYRLFTDVRLINGVGHVRFSEAAAFTGISYVTDTSKREIRLQPRGAT